MDKSKLDLKTAGKKRLEEYRKKKESSSKSKSKPPSSDDLKREGAGGSEDKDSSRSVKASQNAPKSSGIDPENSFWTGGDNEILSLLAPLRTRPPSTLRSASEGGGESPRESGFFTPDGSPTASRSDSARSSRAPFSPSSTMSISSEDFGATFGHDFKVPRTNRVRNEVNQSENQVQSLLRSKSTHSPLLTPSSHSTDTNFNSSTLSGWVVRDKYVERLEVKVVDLQRRLSYLLDQNPSLIDLDSLRQELSAKSEQIKSLEYETVRLKSGLAKDDLVTQGEGKDRLLPSSSSLSSKNQSARIVDLLERHAVEVKDLQDKLRERDERIGVLEKECDRLKEKFVTEVLTERREEAIKLKKMQSEFERSAMGLTKQVSSAMQQLKQLAEDKALLEAQVAAKADELTEEKNRQLALQSELEDLRQQNESLMATVSALQDERSRMITSQKEAPIVESQRERSSPESLDRSYTTDRVHGDTNLKEESKPENLQEVSESENTLLPPKPNDLSNQGATHDTAILNERLFKLENDLANAISISEALKQDLLKSEQRAQEFREKLSMAVKKGKEVVQQREALKNNLAETSVKLQQAIAAKEAAESLLNSDRITSISEEGTTTVSQLRSLLEASEKKSITAENLIEKLKQELENARSQITLIQNNENSEAVIQSLQSQLREVQAKAQSFESKLTETVSMMDDENRKKQLTMIQEEERMMAFEKEISQKNSIILDLQNRVDSTLNQNEMLEQELEETKKSVKEFESKYNGIVLKLDNLKEEVKEKGSKISELQDSLQSTQEALKLEKLNILEKEELVQSLQAKCSTYSFQEEEYLKKENSMIEHVTSSIQTLKSIYSRLKEEIDNFNDSPLSFSHLDIGSQLVSILAELEVCVNAYVHSYRTLKQKELENLNTVESLTKNVAALKIESEEKREQLKEAIRRATELEKIISELEKEREISNETCKKLSEDLSNAQKAEDYLKTKVDEYAEKEVHYLELISNQKKMEEEKSKYTEDILKNLHLSQEKISSIEKELKARDDKISESEKELFEIKEKFSKSVQMGKKMEKQRDELKLKLKEGKKIRASDGVDESQKSVLENTKNEMDRLSLELKNSEMEIIKKKEEISNLLQKIGVKDDKIKELEENIENHKKTIKHKEDVLKEESRNSLNEMNKLNGLISSLQQSYQKTQEEMKDLNSELSTQRGAELIWKQKFQELESNSSSQIQSLEESINSLHKRIDVLQSELNSERKAHQKSKSLVNELEEKLPHLQTDIAEKTEKYFNSEKELKSKLLTKEDEIQKGKNTISKLEEKIRSLEKKISQSTAELEATRKDLTLTKSEFNKLRAEEEKTFSQEEAHEQSLKSLQLQLSDTQQKLEQERKLAALNKEEMEDIVKESANQIAEMKQEIKEKKEQLEEWKTKFSSFSTETNRLNEQLAMELEKHKHLIHEIELRDESLNALRLSLQKSEEEAGKLKDEKERIAKSHSLEVSEITRKNELIEADFRKSKNLLEEKVLDLESKLSRFSEEKTSNENKLTSQLKKAKEIISNLKNKESNLVKSLEDEKREIESLLREERQRLEKATSEMSSLKSSLHETLMENEKLVNDLLDKEQELDLTREQHSKICIALTNEKKQMEEREKQLTVQLNEYKSSMDELSQTKTDIEMRKRQLEHQLEEMKWTKDDSSKGNSLSSANQGPSAVDLKLELDKANETIATVRDKLQRAVKKGKGIEQLKIKLENDMESLNAELSAVKSELESKVKENETLTSQLSTLKSAATNSQNELKIVLDSKNEMLKSIEDLSEKALDNENQLSSVKKELEHVRSTYKTLSEEKILLEKKLEESDRELLRLKSELRNSVLISENLSQALKDRQSVGDEVSKSLQTRLEKIEIEKLSLESELKTEKDKSLDYSLKLEVCDRETEKLKIELSESLDWTSALRKEVDNLKEKLSEYQYLVKIKDDQILDLNNSNERAIELESIVEELREQAEQDMQATLSAKEVSKSKLESQEKQIRELNETIFKTESALKDLQNQVHNLTVENQEKKIEIANQFERFQKLLLSKERELEQVIQKCKEEEQAKEEISKRMLTLDGELLAEKEKLEELGRKLGQKEREAVELEQRIKEVGTKLEEEVSKRKDIESKMEDIQIQWRREEKKMKESVNEYTEMENKWKNSEKKVKEMEGKIWEEEKKCIQFMSDIKVLTERNESLGLSVTSLHSELENNKSELANVLNELEKEKEKSNRFYLDLNSFKSTFQHKELALSEITTSFQIANEKIENQSQKIKSMESELLKSQSDAYEKENKIHDLQSEVSNLLSSTNSLTSQIRSLKKDLQTVESVKEKLNKDLELSNSERDKAIVKLGEKEEIILQLRKNVKFLEEEVMKWKEKAEEEITLLRNQISQNAEDKRILLEKKEDEIKHLRVQLQETIDSMHSVEENKILGSEKMFDLETQIRELKTELDTLQETLQWKESEIDEMKREGEALISEAEEWRLCSEKKNSMLDLTRRERDEIAERMKKMNEIIQQNKMDIDRLNSEVVKTSEYARNMESKSENLKKENEELKRKIDLQKKSAITISSSTSSSLPLPSNSLSHSSISINAPLNLRKSSSSRDPSSMDLEAARHEPSVMPNDTAYDFKTVHASFRNLHPSLQPAAIAIDRLCVTGAQIMFSQPRNRLLFFTYWVALHFWVVATLSFLRV